MDEQKFKKTNQKERYRIYSGISRDLYPSIYGRRFKKAKKSGMDEDRARYLDIEQMVKHELRDAERVGVNGILQNGLESGNNKPFWKYVKSPKQEIFDISALKSNGNVITDSLSKAEILNSKFKSVFTPQSGNTFPQLPGSQFPKI